MGCTIFTSFSPAVCFSPFILLHVRMCWNFPAKVAVCFPVLNLHLFQLGDAGPWVFALFMFTPLPVTQYDQLWLCDDFD